MSSFGMSEAFKVSGSVITSDKKCINKQHIDILILMMILIKL